MAQTFSITVTPVNDAPSFTKGPNQTALEDAGAQSVSGGRPHQRGPDGRERPDAYVQHHQRQQPALFSSAPAIADDGTLTYTSAPDANGVATIQIHLQDNGGTLNGGHDTSAFQTFTITVTAVNDPPSFTKGSDVTVLEDSGLTSRPAGPPTSAPGRPMSQRRASRSS